MELLGYNRSTVKYCENLGNVTVLVEYAGGITGYTTGSNGEDAISYCYNAGNITGPDFVGGIAGAAWNHSGLNTTISYLYNTGTITASKDNAWVGGILGAVYNNVYDVVIDNSNAVKNGYNFGEIIANESQINQVCPEYADVQNIYYVSGKVNNSGYGIGLASNLFPSSELGSVYYQLNQIAPNVWTINNLYNSGMPIFTWQIGN